MPPHTFLVSYSNALLGFAFVTILYLTYTQSQRRQNLVVEVYGMCSPAPQSLINLEPTT